MAEEVASHRSQVPPGDVIEAAADSEKIKSDQYQRRETLWRTLFVTALIVFVGFLVIGLNRTNQSAQRASGEAPAFEFPTFDGETIASTEC